MFLNPANIKDQIKSELIRELIDQLKYEEMNLTKSGGDPLIIRQEDTTTCGLVGNYQSEDG
jgi:hypothetical protein